MFSPYKYAPSYWVWRTLERSQKGKDVFDPLFRIINKTKIYDMILKRTPWYYTGILCATTVLAWGWGRTCDQLFLMNNEGLLYGHNPYKSPPKDDDDDDDDEEEDDEEEEEEEEEIEQEEAGEDTEAADREEEDVDGDGDDDTSSDEEQPEEEQEEDKEEEDDEDEDDD